MYLLPAHWNILETLSRMDKPEPGHMVADASGWSRPKCLRHLGEMTFLGLVSRRGGWQITERGKIALAINAGKERKAADRRGARLLDMRVAAE